jgi:hypothetical protein
MLIIKQVVRFTNKRVNRFILRKIKEDNQFRSTRFTTYRNVCRFFVSALSELFEIIIFAALNFVLPAV